MELYLPSEIEKLVASNAKKLRLRARLKQETLSKKAGVSLGSLKRFESSGKISLINLLKIAGALESLSGFLKLFSATKAINIKDLEKMEQDTKRGTI